MRLLGVAYPVVTTLVVVSTANHYLLDAVAGAVVVAVGIRLARTWAPDPVRATAPETPLGAFEGDVAQPATTLTRAA